MLQGECMINPKKMSKKDLADLVRRLQEILGGKETHERMGSTEVDALVEWVLGHRDMCAQPEVGLTFTPTGIGTAIRVKCECGAEADLSDYDSW